MKVPRHEPLTRIDSPVTKANLVPGEVPRWLRATVSRQRGLVSLVYLRVSSFPALLSMYRYRRRISACERVHMLSPIDRVSRLRESRECSTVLLRPQSFAGRARARGRGSRSYRIAILRERIRFNKPDQPRTLSSQCTSDCNRKMLPVDRGSLVCALCAHARAHVRTYARTHVRFVLYTVRKYRSVAILASPPTGRGITIERRQHFTAGQTGSRGQSESRKSPLNYAHANPHTASAAVGERQYQRRDRQWSNRGGLRNYDRYSASRRHQIPAGESVIRAKRS